MKCPCNKNKQYQDCCEPFHLKKQRPVTPEQLMRSRYSAFALQKYPYLIDTHHQDHLHGLNIEILSQGPHPQWIFLDIIDTQIINNKGQVTFKAWYRLNNKIDAIYECSDFIKQNDQWFYTKGEQYQITLPKRNDLCICKSGKKFKQCCLLYRPATLLSE